MKKIRSMVVAVVTAAAVTIGLALPTTATAAAATLEQKRFVWRSYMTSGSCTIEPGATWTLYSNGTARLDATVSSLDGDDAWLMWAHLKDDSGSLLADIQVYGSSSTKFVKNLPNRERSYRWLAKGQFDPELFDLVERMSLGKHC
ncbi:DUF6294 family protein [Nonomuraea pusilla]|uniref:DUF6294 domain-containing protein n=1 Tax=Nonomuraea pusilla TaxID=46177 RepID=A0A1H7XLS9_9ACTN|nr:DUF6294 family protein [Nonomuraea pusilla]SEM34594.1 hypothetical protein SAMN05660976_04868 [Nonomuraea pusilla]